MQRELARVEVDAGERGASALRLTDVRSLLDDHLAGRPTRANFRAGSLTVCTMVPMRSVPHRVVCLLGLDDGIFPRQRTVDGDDVLARTPVTGERDVRSEDRQLLLDAIGAATERLVVTYTGADAHSGQPRPPAVPLGELLDALDRTTTAPVKEQIVVHHPLQGYDRPQRRAGPARHPDAVHLRPADAGRREGRARAAAGPAAVPPRAADHAGDPRGRRRRPGAERPGPVLPRPGQGLLPGPRPDPALGRRRRQRRDAGRDRPARVVGRGRPDARRHAPRHPSRHGARDRVAPRCAAARAARLAQGHRGPRDRDEPRGRRAHPPSGASHARSTSTSSCRGGRRLTGTITPVYGDRLVAVGYSKLDGKHLLESWVRLLALAAGHPDHNWTALTIGRVTARHPGRAAAARADGGRAADAAQRPRRPLRRGSAGAARAADQDVVRLGLGGPHRPGAQARRRSRSGRAAGSPARTPPPRTSGSGASTPTSTDLPRLGELAERLWLPLLRSERGPL